MDWVIDIDSLNNGSRMSELKTSICLNPDNNTKAPYEERGKMATGIINNVPSTLCKKRT